MKVLNVMPFLYLNPNLIFNHMNEMSPKGLHQRNFTFASWLQGDVGYSEDLKLLSTLQITLIHLSHQPKWSVLIFSLRLHQPGMHNDELQVTAKNPVTIVPHRGYYISIFMLKWQSNVYCYFMPIVPLAPVRHTFGMSAVCLWDENLLHFACYGSLLKM